MGITKSAHFTEAQNQLAMQLKALAHPARIAILEFLLKTDSCICGDIVNELPLSQATVSQHLKEMKNARIIKGTIEGNAICYCIDQDQFNQLTQQMVQINEVLKTKNNQCC
jgi:DNA-binding transcriptional ArsR family regulator